MITMKGYKAFNSDLTCKDYQYAENQVHVYDGIPVLCNSGFHFCTELQDVLKYYHTQTMKVYEIEASGIITDSKPDCSKRSCSELKLIKEVSLEDVKNSITKSEPAYWWARDIGDQEYLKQFITDSEYALRWGLSIGDREHMKQFITESLWAYYWAKEIGDREYMKQFITESEWAYNWARDFGDQEYMKQFIINSYWAYCWINFINPDDEAFFKNKGII